MRGLNQEEVQILRQYGQYINIPHSEIDSLYLAVGDGVGKRKQGAIGLGYIAERMRKTLYQRSIPAIETLCEMCGLRVISERGIKVLVINESAINFSLTGLSPRSAMDDCPVT